MKSFEIHINDLQRILFGEVPPSFFLEVILRTAFIYVVLMLSMRLMGNRMSSMLGRNEMAAMVSLAATIGVPIQSPDRGLLPIVIMAFIVVVFQTWIAKRSTKNKRFEQLSQDDIAPLIEDNVLNLRAMKLNGITRERLFAQLRSEKITHLGRVKRLYLEANGSFSLLQNTRQNPGLSILPRSDDDFFIPACYVQSAYACYKCGYVVKDHPKKPDIRCPNCKEKKWEAAIDDIDQCY